VTEIYHQNLLFKNYRKIIFCLPPQDFVAHLVKGELMTQIDVKSCI